MDIWEGFKGKNWKINIDVEDFIINNYTEYLGDESFLSGVSLKTSKLLKKYEKILKREEDLGILDIDTYNVASINGFEKGYVDYKNEVIYGLQTDECLKRIINLYSGLNSTKKMLEKYGYHIDRDVERMFNEFRKTHTKATFDCYTDEINKARKSYLITGLPDEYDRGKIIGDYRRVALYGVDYLIQKKNEDIKKLASTINSTTIRLREEVSEQINALEEMKKMAKRYDIDISKPASNAREAVQWIYFAYLANVKENNGFALSFGRNISFIDIYIERDLNLGKITEEEAQELIDQLMLKLRMVRHLRNPFCDELFYQDSNFITVVTGGMLDNNKSFVTKSDYRIINSLNNLGYSCEPIIEVLWSYKLPVNFKKYCSSLVIKSNLIRFENDDLIRNVFGTDYAISTSSTAFKYGKQIELFGSSLNLPKVLMYAINGGKDEITLETVVDGIEELNGEYLDFDLVLKNFEKVLKKSVKLYVDALNIVHYMHDKYNYEAGMMALNDTMVERLMEFSITGLTTVVDSLSAINYGHVRVKRNENGITKTFDIEREYPKFGNDDDSVDLIASKIINRIYKELTKYALYRNSIPTLSTVSMNYNVLYGNHTGATPDGRKAGISFCEGVNAIEGNDKNGLTSLFKSIAKIPYKNCLGGIYSGVNVEPILLGTDSSMIDNLIHMIDSFFLGKGQYLNINIVERENLINIMANPVKYPNVMIKSFGNNVNFSRLNRLDREAILCQTFHNKM